MGTPLFMIAAARMDQRSLLLVALLMIVVALLATAFFPVFALMMVSRIVVGIDSGIYGVTAGAGLGGLGVVAARTTSLILWLGAAAVAVATGLMALSFGMAGPGREKLPARP